MNAHKEEVINTIKEYDMALMTGTENTLNPTKTGWTTLIGTAEKDETVSTSLILISLMALS